MRRELAGITLRLAEVTVKEQAAEPGSTERNALMLERVRLEARAWEFKHLLYAAEVARGVFDAEAYSVVFANGHPSPTVEQLDAARAAHEQRVKVAKRRARKVVAISTDPDRAKRYLERVKQRRQEYRQEQQYGMGM